MTSIRPRLRAADLPGYLLLAFWTLLVLIPIWVMVVNSFKPSLDIFRDPFGLPLEPTRLDENHRRHEPWR